VQSDPQPAVQESGPKARSFIEDARRRQIISATVATVAEIGFQRTTLAEVARRAGISKGVISYHFAGKDELLREVVLQIFQQGEDAMRPALAGAADPRAALHAYIRTNLAFVDANRPEMVALVEILSRSDLFSPEAEAPAIEALVRLFAAGHEAGLFRPFDSSVMAVTVRRAIDAAVDRLTHQPDHDVIAHAEELVELFDRATRKDPA
jgi:TetR/AcrR family fatty acid metabolism transcriptional regulator